MVHRSLYPEQRKLNVELCTPPRGRVYLCDPSHNPFALQQDHVQRIQVDLGNPFEGKTSGKTHPIYNLTMYGTSTERTRAFRFRVFREYHQLEVTGQMKVKAKFPETKLLSSFGIPMSEKDIKARCAGLDAYMKEVCAVVCRDDTTEARKRRSHTAFRYPAPAATRASVLSLSFSHRNRDDTLTGVMGERERGRERVSAHCRPRARHVRCAGCL